VSESGVQRLITERHTGSLYAVIVMCGDIIQRIMKTLLETAGHRNCNGQNSMLITSGCGNR
jgi:hypothetical protein